MHAVYNQDAPEDGGISLHSFLHVQPNLRRGERTVRLPDLVQELNTMQTSLIRDLLVWLARRERLLDMVSASTAEHDDVKQRVGTETVRTVDRYAGGFTSRIETRDNLVLAILVLCDNLTGVPGRNTAH